MKPTAKLLLAASLTLSAPLAGAAAESSMKPADSSASSKPMPTMMAPKVGDAAPAFTLQNAEGAEVSLDSLLGQGRVAVVFFRSADWCPFCVAQLQELQASLPLLEQAGISVVGISYDPVATLARAARKHGLTFPLLSDEGSKTIAAYGIRNEEAKGKALGTPHPAVFLLDAKGTIQAKLMHEGYKTRPAPADIVAAAKQRGTM